MTSSSCWRKDFLSSCKALIWKSKSGFVFIPHPFIDSSSSSLQACFAFELLGLYKELLASGQDLGADISSLFAEPLNPVAPKAQKKVPIPEGLNLDQWINEPPDFTESIEPGDDGFGFLKEEQDDPIWKQDPAEIAKVIQSSLFYLNSLLS